MDVLWKLYKDINFEKYQVNIDKFKFIRTALLQLRILMTSS